MILMIGWRRDSLLRKSRIRYTVEQFNISYETIRLGGGLMKWAVLGFVVTLVILCGTDAAENT